MKNASKNPLIIIAIISVALIGLAIWYSDSTSKAANDGVEVQSHVKGNPDADVILVEFADFQCPACAQFHPVVKDVEELYGDRVRIEFRHFPLIAAHPNAEPAARAAEAAGQQGKFFEFHDILFERQADWSGSVNPTNTFVTYAQELGLDIEAFRTHMKSSVLRDKIRSDMDEGRERGVTGTPTFFINGQRVEGMQTLGDLIARVEDKLGITQEEEGVASSTADSQPQPAAPAVRFGL